MLTDLAIRKLKRRTLLYRVADARGLCIEVPPTGSLRWRFRYRFDGKFKMIGFGTYPDVTLEEARAELTLARKSVKNGRDPSAERQAVKLHAINARARSVAEAKSVETNTFAAVAREWMQRQRVAEFTERKNQWLLDYLLPDLGPRPITAIKPRELLDVLRKIESTNKLETAARVKIKAGQVFRFAIMEGQAESDPTTSLRGALKPPVVKHHAAITEPARIGDLLRAIDGFVGQPETMFALKLAPLLFVRPGELRKAEWQEFDLDGAMWRIPGERMKMKSAHLVPLSTQAITILRELNMLSGSGKLLFPGLRSASRPISNNTLNAALRRLGYSTEEMTAHGFRSMAATRLNEMGWRADAIERQLAHAESNKVRDAYTSAAQYLEERKKMMQAWADYLDVLKNRRCA